MLANDDEDNVNKDIIRVSESDDYDIKIVTRFWRWRGYDDEDDGDNDTVDCDRDNNSDVNDLVGDDWKMTKVIMLMAKVM